MPAAPGRGQDAVLAALRRENEALRATLLFYERTQLPPLTRTQAKLQRFLRTFLARHEYAPSFDEIKAHMGWRSLASVHEMLGILEQKGYIRRHHHVARAISIAPAAL